MKHAIRAITLTGLLLASVAYCQNFDPGESAQTGKFRLTATLAEAVGAASAENVASIISPDENLSWEFYVPESYRPEKPAGLMVYISPSPSGSIPRRWRSVLEKHNIIWIAANHSGNRVTVARRAVYALVAPTLVAKRYNIDHNRVYVAGLSGGGRMAGKVAIDYPKLFKGAIYNCGIDFWDEQKPHQLELVKQNHFVFVTGTKDHALRQTKVVHKQYLQAGVANSKLMVIRDMPHQNPDKDEFNEAIQFLDSRLTSPVKAQTTTN